jgi:hypothetical protein
MKGIVFTEFLDFVAAQFSEDLVDDIIADCSLQSGGAYTSVGTYDHREMQALVAALAQHTQHSAPQLLSAFGRHLCGQFSKSHPDFFARTAGLFDFLESVQQHIHVEVRKLYPDAELPSFETHARAQELLELNYRSCRPLAALAEGLILGASDHYREPVTVAQKSQTDAAGSFVRLEIARVA